MQLSLCVVDDVIQRVRKYLELFCSIGEVYDLKLSHSIWGIGDLKLSLNIGGVDDLKLAHKGYRNLSQFCRTNFNG